MPTLEMGSAVGGTSGASKEDSGLTEMEWEPMAASWSGSDFGAEKDEPKA